MLAQPRGMPVYEYECRGCGQRFTEMMSIDDHEKRKLQCPRCKSQSTEALVESYVATTKKS